LNKFPSSQPRAGLFTRAAFLFSGFPDENPPIRGARIRIEYLCDSIIQPADTTPPAGVVVPPNPTVRQQIEAKTQLPGSSCIGCHAPKINPLGFPLGNYDSMGRYRTQEALLDSMGKISNWANVNAVTQPQIASTTDTTTVNNGIEFSNLIGQHGKLQSCFVRNYFRYFMARTEDDTQDSCLLEELRQGLADPNVGGLQNLIKAMPKTSEFTIRKVNL
jgi:hypothetical protein